MEALLLKTNIQSSPNLEWLSRHVPISVSIASNVPNYEPPISFAEKDIGTLIKTMVTYLLEISTSAYTLSSSWQPIMMQIDDVIRFHQNLNSI